MRRETGIATPSKLCSILILTLALVLLACDQSGDDGATLPPLQAGNNSATISGELIGMSAHNTDLLHENVTALLQSEHHSLVLGQAVKTRAKTDTTEVRWIIPVTNTGNTALSGVVAEGLTCLDADGLPMEYAGDTTIRLTGNVGCIDAMYTSDCLAPGERGWLVGKADLDYDRLAVLRFCAITDDNRRPTNPEAIVRPEGYTYYYIEGYYNELYVTLHNTSDRDGQLIGGGICVFLARNDSPLYWMSLCNPCLDAGILYAHENHSLVSDTMQYTGICQRIAVHTYYRDLPEDFFGLPTE